MFDRPNFNSAGHSFIHLHVKRAHKIKVYVWLLL